MEVHVEAPKPVADCLARILERVEQGGLYPSATKFVVDAPAPSSSALDAAEGLISDVAHYVSEQIEAQVLRGAVVCRDGLTLALLGSAESSTLLAAHLTARGWSLLSPRYAFFMPTTRNVVPFPTLMRVQATAIDRYPKAYRRAFEMSPWCSSEQTIAFYAVDPAKAKPTASWEKEGRLGGVVIVRDDVGTQPELSEFEAQNSDLFYSLKGGQNVPHVTLTLGPMAFTTTLLERWSETIS